MKRKRLLTAAAGTLVAAAIAGVAWASIPGPGNVYSACMLKGLGTIRLIDKSLPSTNLMSRCTDKEIEIAWNQAGQPGPPGPQGAKGDLGERGTNGTNGTDGKDGVSVTSAVEPAGSNCANGGSKFTASNGASYACNGAQGPQGPAGPAGTGGAVAWARVSANGTMVAGSSGIVVTKIATGTYEIRLFSGFDPNACAVLTTAATFDTAATTQQLLGTRDSYTVYTFRDWNSLTGSPGILDAPFSTAIFC
jgi:hypothetical protein